MLVAHGTDCSTDEGTSFLISSSTPARRSKTGGARLFFAVPQNLVREVLTFDVVLQGARTFADQQIQSLFELVVRKPLQGLFRAAALAAALARRGCQELQQRLLRDRRGRSDLTCDLDLKR